MEARESPKVPRDAEVPEVTSQLLGEHLLLLADFVVAVLPAPHRDPLERPSEAVLRGPALRTPGSRLSRSSRPSTAARSPPC